ncbi:ATP-dependent nuclease [Delftia sp. CH05]|uniref:ATP-dependent nuclease n=1 Tax=Delftia sp. CH05 TaxID=2692194 RepID=UPI00135DBF1C|nr:AAA family ATPase [Delftia sp. CH05]MXN28142.1 AAA family ATPase [Delftia sp. CH05]
MQIARVEVKNFRGIETGTVNLSGHTVFLGDNNVGKSTLLEAVDLVLGPERLSRRPVIDEHDFYAGRYLDEAGNAVPIHIEVVVSDLSEEQQRHFYEHIEWWSAAEQKLLEGPPAEGTDADGVAAALRLFFQGSYDVEEDDFRGNTFFASPPLLDGTYSTFKTTDKRKCGFLYLRTLRTGARALSLERGSLLDVILRLQDKRVTMWEDLLKELRTLPVADKEELGIAPLLKDVQDAVRRFVPSDWAEQPHMRVSDLTRESLRKDLTVFMGTGAKRADGSTYSAPYQHQGTGTINTLVLALLSIIAGLKQNVIFAMEEPEIALPPHTQKRIVNSVRGTSAQALFTSHSPYVLEEFKPSELQVLRRTQGKLSAVPASYPPSIKPKTYKANFRARFCEALLARYVLIVEGRTEFDAVPAAARRLNELNPVMYKTLEALGVAVIDAGSDAQVAPLGQFFRGLGKTVFAVFDKQAPAASLAIKQAVDYPFESAEKGFENVVLLQTGETALRRYALSVVNEGSWPQHLEARKPTAASTINQVREVLWDFFSWAKGSGDAGDLLGNCLEAEMPEYLKAALHKIHVVVEPPQLPPLPPIPRLQPAPPVEDDDEL